jgi:hypothetical protein
MNAWTLIRDRLTKNERPGSCGHQASLNVAADVFIRIMPLLRETPKDIAKIAFNEDEEVREALLNRAALKEVLPIRL